MTAVTSAVDGTPQESSRRRLELGDMVYSENIGAYSHASSTFFNGFPPQPR